MCNWQRIYNNKFLVYNFQKFNFVFLSLRYMHVALLHEYLVYFYLLILIYTLYDTSIFTYLFLVGVCFCRKLVIAQV